MTMQYLHSKLWDKKIILESSENVYPLKANPEDNWLFYAFFGFEKFQEILNKEGKNIRNFASIGTGNGFDAIGAYYIFKNVKELIVVDICPEAVRISKNNLERNIRTSSGRLNIIALEGSLCKPIRNINQVVDLIYGNLPNIPYDSDDINVRYKQSTFYNHNLYEDIDFKSLTKYLLKLQFLFLTSAREVLSSQGSVLPLIGGRFPYYLFSEMFKMAGYNFQEICSGFKLQTEADEALSGYTNAEEVNNVEFDFYLYEESKIHMENKGIANPTADFKGNVLKEFLEEFRVSAAEANRLHKSGVKIGHTCHLFRTIPKDKSR